MISKFKNTPFPLKAVCVVYLCLGVLQLIGLVFNYGEFAVQNRIVAISYAVFTVLVLLGVMEKSKFIRKLLLVIAWLEVVIPFLILPFLGMIAGLEFFYLAIPFAISVFTIWGFMNRESKHYFGIPERKWET